MWFRCFTTLTANFEFCRNCCIDHALAFLSAERWYKTTLNFLRNKTSFVVSLVENFIKVFNMISLNFVSYFLYGLLCLWISFEISQTCFTFWKRADVGTPVYCSPSISNNTNEYTVMQELLSRAHVIGIYKINTTHAHLCHYEEVQSGMIALETMTGGQFLAIGKFQNASIFIKQWYTNLYTVHRSFILFRSKKATFSL